MLRECLRVAMAIRDPVPTLLSPPITPLPLIGELHRPTIPPILIPDPYPVLDRHLSLPDNVPQATTGWRLLKVHPAGVCLMVVHMYHQAPQVILLREVSIVEVRDLTHQQEDVMTEPVRAVQTGMGKDA